MWRSPGTYDLLTCVVNFRKELLQDGKLKQNADLLQDVELLQDIEHLQDVELLKDVEHLQALLIPVIQQASLSQNICVTV